MVWYLSLLVTCCSLVCLQLAVSADRTVGVPIPLRVGSWPTSYLPWFKLDPTTGDCIGGFICDFFDLFESICLTNQALPCFSIEWVTMNDPNFYTNMSVVQHEYLANYSVDLFSTIDSSIIAQYDDVITTQAMYTQWYIGMVKKTVATSDVFLIFSPFTRRLWLSLLATIMVGGIVLYLLIIISRDEKPKVVDYFYYLYHVAASILGGDEYEFYSAPPVGRLFRLAILFFVVVIVSTYTANLAAILTRPQYSYGGPLTLEDLQSSVACFRIPRTPGEWIVPKFVSDMLLPPSDIPTFALLYAWGRQMLQDGECDVIIELEGNAILESLNYCDSMYLPPGIRLAPIPLFNVLRKEDAELERFISLNILVVLQSPEYMSILSNNLGIGKSCSKSGGTNKIDVDQMAGLFAVFGSVSVFVVVAALVDRLYRGQPRSREDEKFQLQEKVDEVLHILRGLTADAPDSSRASSATDISRGDRGMMKVAPLNGDTKDDHRGIPVAGAPHDNSVYTKVLPFDEIECDTRDAEETGSSEVARHAFGNSELI